MDPAAQQQSFTPHTHGLGTAWGTMIVYYDGVCGLCNGFVTFLLKHDPQGRLRFTPLQGETAQARLTARQREQLQSVVIDVNGRTFEKTAAVVRILWQLGPAWRVLAALLWLVPRPLRDAGYNVVARYRYALFGKRESCRLPAPAERERFLP